MPIFWKLSFAAYSSRLKTSARYTKPDFSKANCLPTRFQRLIIDHSNIQIYKSWMWSTYMLQNRNFNKLQLKITRRDPKSIVSETEIDLRSSQRTRGLHRQALHCCDHEWRTQPTEKAQEFELTSGKDQGGACERQDEEATGQRSKEKAEPKGPSSLSLAPPLDKSTWSASATNNCNLWGRVLAKYDAVFFFTVQALLRRIKTSM